MLHPRARRSGGGLYHPGLRRVGPPGGLPTASDAKRAEEPGRWIRVDWATGELASYQTALDISAKDRDGLTWTWP